MYYTLSPELYHHGIKGMHWGVRRYQNPDGSLTSAGRKRYDDSPFTASNGLKVGAAKTRYQKIARGTEKVLDRTGLLRNDGLAERAYRRNTSGKYMSTNENALSTERGIQRMRKERDALREYNAHQKDFRKGTGTKYLDKAIRRNKLDAAYEDVKSATTKREARFYNDATRRKAAKYVVDKNMSIKDAKKKANTDAIRNTMLILAAYGAMSAYAMSKNK